MYIIKCDIVKEVLKNRYELYEEVELRSEKGDPAPVCRVLAANPDVHNLRLVDSEGNTVATWTPKE